MDCLVEPASIQTLLERTLQHRVQPSEACPLVPQTSYVPAVSSGQMSLHRIRLLWEPSMDLCRLLHLAAEDTNPR
eukprot:1084633-Pleurochrysis_carterae.AAC.1